MTTCPICKSPATDKHARDGDWQYVECERCGNYNITDTALALLPSRLEVKGDIAVAQLSHAVRTLRKYWEGSKPIEINSQNLDQLIQQPLPAIEEQMTSLLKWMARKLGDSPLGSLQLIEDTNLVALIGTVDVEGLSALIRQMEKAKLIAYAPGDRFRILAEGWERLDTALLPLAKSGATTLASGATPQGPVTSKTVVEIDPNAPAILALHEKLDHLAEILRFSNSAHETLGGDKDRLVAELSASKTLIRVSRVDTSLLERLVSPALKFIAKVLADQGGEILVKEAVKKLSGYFGINIDL